MPRGSTKRAVSTAPASDLAENGVVSGSGNVFADLDLEDAEELLLRAKLVHLVATELRRRKIPKSAVAGAVGLPPGAALELVERTPLNVTAETMLAVLRRLGCNIDIVVSDADGEEASIRVRSEM